jgi:allophanate hydrolase subunit 2
MAHAVFECSVDCMVAIVGAESTVRVDDTVTASNRSFELHQGQILAIEPPRIGARQYVAFQNGSRVPPRALDRPPSVQHRHSIAIIPHRPVLLPETWREIPLVVSGTMSRMGIRLPWFPGFLATTEEASRPVDVGQIQLTPDGTAIILGPDGPTIGGYPIVASVHPYHLARVAQWTPGLIVWMTDTVDGSPEAKFLAQLRIAIGV